MGAHAVTVAAARALIVVAVVAAGCGCGRGCRRGCGGGRGSGGTVDDGVLVGRGRVRANGKWERCVP